MASSTRTRTRQSLTSARSPRRTPPRKGGGSSRALALSALGGALALLAVAVFVATGDRAPTSVQDPAALVAVDHPPVPLAPQAPAAEAPTPAQPRAKDPYAELQKELQSEPAPAPAPAAPAPTTEPSVERVRVQRVIDGDTVVLADGRRVRLIGMNTPERGRPLYQEAKEALAEMIEGDEVSIVYGKDPTDKYGRTLAYLHEGETFVNGEIVRKGLAYVYTWRPNTRHAEGLKLLQQEARAEGLGLWGLEAPSPSPRGYRSSRWHHRFHRPDCGKAAKIRQKDLVEWDERNEALDEGFNPCETCKS